MAEIESITERTIGCIIRVHHALGPGFLESIYRNALLLELEKEGLRAEQEKEVQVYYDGVEVGRHRLDILVEDVLVLELKTVEQLSRAHYSQIRSYLKATNLTNGLLVNFASAKADFRRVRMDDGN